MTAYLLTGHFLNFLAPAAGVAVMLALMSRIFSRFFIGKALSAQSLYVQAAIVFIVNTCILTVGLMVFKNDGKMATYAAMVLGGAVAQWVLGRGWAR